MVNKSAVGLEGPAFEIAIERGKVREFARATQSHNAEYLAAPEPPIPPTFLTTVSFWQPPEGSELWRKIDIDGRRLLHGEQEYEFFGRVPAAGTTLTARTRVEEIYEKEGKRGGTMTFVVSVTDFHDGAGELVAGAVDRHRDRQGAVVRRCVVTPTEVTAGSALAPRSFGPLTRTDFVRYQGASGDFNPIHHDETYARSAGFPTVFSVGMLQAGLLATYCTDLLGPANVRRFKVQFREQVWPDDVLTASGTVVKSYEAEGESRVDLEVVMTRQTGGVAIRGEATFAALR